MDLTQVGYFSKTHGVKGHLILKIDKEFFEDQVKAVFIESSTGKAPYFISEIKSTNNGLIIALEEITAVEKAKTLIGKAVYIDSSLIEEVEEEFDWIGFELIDKHHGSLGNITATSDNGHQVLLSIDYKNKEILLPLVEDFIEKIDEEGKKLYFNAPEGLIDLYISDSGEGPTDEEE
ncbi:16S rRNA processing protein RimM [Sphingobacteriaceae bacterium]|nr:16S rRNA processing protein RimM [Sphingobacteriaceae bacterium]